MVRFLYFHFFSVFEKSYGLWIGEKYEKLKNEPKNGLFLFSDSEKKKYLLFKNKQFF